MTLRLHSTKLYKIEKISIVQMKERKKEKEQKNRREKRKVKEKQSRKRSLEIILKWLTPPQLPLNCQICRNPRGITLQGLNSPLLGLQLKQDPKDLKMGKGSENRQVLVLRGQRCGAGPAQAAGSLTFSGPLAQSQRSESGKGETAADKTSRKTRPLLGTG